MQHKMIEARKPPVLSVGFIGWCREKLFATPTNSLITLVIIYGLITLVPPFIQWALIDAVWVGAGSSECNSDGACWAFVSSRLDQFIYGFYPQEQSWRVDLFFVQLALVLAWLMIPSVPGKKYGLAYGLIVMPVTSWIVLAGGWLGLEAVDTHDWGGLMVTLVLAMYGMLASLPIGVLLALGRRSNMPAVKTFCTVYIELWRGVPLITVLFMASVMLPLFVPEEIVFDKLVRAMIGIVMFQSAYMAEVVRGGLQAIPKGQQEACDSLGMGYWQSMLLVVLPQAVRLVIPGIVNTFIALFKDTSLVLVIGLFDLLSIVQAGLNDPAWLGTSTEGYLFAGLVFWLFCFGMSRYSQSLENNRQQH